LEPQGTLLDKEKELRRGQGTSETRGGPYTVEKREGRATSYYHRKEKKKLEKKL